MVWLFVFEQTLNGLQFGVTLFLMAAGLTLVLGIMNFVNLAHGSFYMLGAYLAATAIPWTGNYLAGAILAVLATAIVAIAAEMIALRPLFKRSHLDQVLSTVGLLIFMNEAVRMIWGPSPLNGPTPAALAGSVHVLPNLPYPSFRLFVIAAGLAVAVALYLVITRTRIGMLIRAGATDRQMTASMGVNITRLNGFVFGVGAALAALSGLLAAPVSAVQSGMGDRVLVLTLVVIVIGGVGSIKGAFLAALLVGLADTFGRSLLPGTLASMVIYCVMALVLFFRPEGLFASRV